MVYLSRFHPPAGKFIQFKMIHKQSFFECQLRQKIHIIYHTNNGFKDFEILKVNKINEYFSCIFALQIRRILLI